MNTQDEMQNKIDKKLLEKRVINFFSGKKEYRSLSNFWEREVIVEGIVYESGEHCYHGERCRKIGLMSSCQTRRMELIEYSGTFAKPSPYKTGVEVKKMGGKKGLKLTDEEMTLWYEMYSEELQVEICKWKIANYEEVRADLAKSEDKLLVHPAMRCNEAKVAGKIWEGKGIVKDGVVSVIGQNRLGNIWMRLRSQDK